MMKINNKNYIEINNLWYKIIKSISPNKKFFKNYLFVNFTLEDLENHYKDLYTITDSYKENKNNLFFDMSMSIDDCLNDIFSVLKKKKISGIR